MIEIEKRSVKSTQFIKLPRRVQDKSPRPSESFIDSFSKQSSIYSNDRFDSTSSGNRQRSHLFSLDYVQSTASFVYPNTRVLSSGYAPTGKNSIYLFSNKKSPNKPIPLAFVGCDYFLRKPIDFEQLKYPITTSDILEPLIDLFITRPQFIKEIPQLDDLSIYRLLPQSISGLLFINSSTRHTCSEFNENKFTVQDLLNMSRRENNIIQINALNDKRYHALKDELNEIYSYQHSPSRNGETIAHQSRKILPTIVTSVAS